MLASRAASLAAVLVALVFQCLVLRLLTTAAPIVRLISTLGLLVVVQSAVELRYGNAEPPRCSRTSRTTCSTGVACVVQEQVLYIIGITLVVTFVLWAFAKYSRVGLAITAAAQNERAVQTMGWSPNQAVGDHVGRGRRPRRLAGVLLAPLTGLSTITFTLIVTVTAMAAALLGGFRSFPLTLAGRVHHRVRRGGGRRATASTSQDFFGVGRPPRASSARSRSC